MTRLMPLSLTLVAATSWAAATVLTKVTLRELSPLDLLGVELGSSAVAMVCLLVARGRPFLPRNWRMFALLGVLEPGLSFGLFDFGLSRTGAADGAILIASQSLFGVLLARALLGERVSPVTRVAVAIGFAGSALVGLAETGHGASLSGDLLVLAASAAAASNGVGVRRIERRRRQPRRDDHSTRHGRTLCRTDHPARRPGSRTHLASADAQHLLAAVATGLLGGAVPFLAFNRAIRDLTVAHAGLILNLIPVLAAGGAVALLGERLRWPEIVGGLLVIVAATASAAVDDLPLASRRRNRCLSQSASVVG